jgi:hydrogenase maturation protein HypF
MEVEGEEEALQGFVDELVAGAPALASIEEVSTTRQASAGYTSFEIRESVAESNRYQLISPDAATCGPCLKEILESGDRRYRYPFTNCTNCGPRFTIIEDIPYDRRNTTMRRFDMCSHCRREYDDPLDRRFHAQPNACPVCGPSVQLVDAAGKTLPCDDVVGTAAQLLREGKVLAVKGLGGFLLACDATSEGAVLRLRKRKRRLFKPLAIMVASLEEATRLCDASPEEERLLSSPQRPIVLLGWRKGSSVTPAVAPDLKYLGVMLPYTPLHHLLLREVGRPLVMTSGNMSEEPIAQHNEEALARLCGIADFFLVHNRDIYSRYDDSVALVELGRPRLVRRARGYAPHPIHLPFAARQVLACGPEMKNTFCLTRESHAFVSQHIGDLENMETLEHYENTIDLYERLFRVRPQVVAHDMHPEYLSTRYAMSLAEAEPDLALVPVQHHHAHVVSCMVENGVEEPVIGVALDGTGYGTDGCIWGGEFLVADYRGFRRTGHLEYVPMPGGAAAIERPYRMALGYLTALLGGDVATRPLPFLDGVGREEIGVVVRQVERKLNAPLTSSCGRLFDAVSALIGVRGTIDYEAQAAIELEMAADEGKYEAYPFSIEDDGNTRVVRLRGLFEGLLADLEIGAPPGVMSTRFHNTMAAMVSRMCRGIADETGIEKVALSGGVFQNRLLLRLAMVVLEEAGLEVLTHARVPANDGGVSLGQAVVGDFATR